MFLHGTNNLTISNLNISSNNTIINSTAYITLNVNDNAVFTNITIPGPLIVNSGANVTFYGGVGFKGSIYAGGEGGTQINVADDLICNSMLLGGYNNQIALNIANITTQLIKLDGFEMAVIGYWTSIISGNLVNNGSIIFYGNSELFILGNYSQLQNASFSAFNISLGLDRLIILIADSIVVYGTFTFGIISIHPSTTTIMSAKNGLIGNISDKPLVLDLFEGYHPSLVYDNQYLSLVINQEHKIEWWVWLLVGVGGGLVILVAVGILVRIYKNRIPYTQVLDPNANWANKNKIKNAM